MNKMAPALPAVQRSLSISLTPGPAAAAEARRQVREAVETWGLSADPYVAALLTSELVTNAIRHAPGAAIQVRLACGDGVRVEIVNQAPPPGAAGIGELGSGHGLTGLAERVAALGGAIRSGPVPAGGWRLSAEFPATA